MLAIPPSVDCPLTSPLPTRGCRSCKLPTSTATSQHRKILPVSPTGSPQPFLDDSTRPRALHPVTKASPSEEERGKRCRPIRHTMARRVSNLLAACIIGPPITNHIRHISHTDARDTHTRHHKICVLHSHMFVCLFSDFLFFPNEGLSCPVPVEVRTNTQTSHKHLPLAPKLERD